MKIDGFVAVCRLIKLTTFCSSASMSSCQKVGGWLFLVQPRTFPNVNNRRGDWPGNKHFLAPRQWNPCAVVQAKFKLLLSQSFQALKQLRQHLEPTLGEVYIWVPVTLYLLENADNVALKMTCILLIFIVL